MKLNELTSRDDIAIILITQNVASRLQSIIESYTSPLPAILEIPSKDQPYDYKRDMILKRVQRMFQEDTS